MHKFSENFLPGYGAFSSALGGETSDKVETAEFINMENYHNGWAIAQASGVGSGKILTLTILEATSSAGAGSATTSKTDTFTATATTQKDVLQAEIKADELSAGYTHFGARLATDNTTGTEKVSVILIAGSPRYAQNSLPANS